jgi:uncharacterized protein YndB with AHSA1/START domain
VTAEWVPTDSIATDDRLLGFDAVWCVPASPYRSTDGALRAIRFARERQVPFLGTCGGFQHAVVEYARSVLGWSHAEHAETVPEAELPVITALECALVEAPGAVRFREGSRLREAYAAGGAVEGYHCRYGINPQMRDALTAGPLHVAAEDDHGDIRAVELDGHPFFVATLFQPERAALRNEIAPIVQAFVEAAADVAATPKGSLMTTRIDSASRLISATPQALYSAFAEPGAMEQWIPPGNMTGQMVHFDFREGGSYRMRLTYADPQPGRGKSSDDSDDVEVRLTKLVDGRRIEQEVTFESADPAFSGIMRMVWTFRPATAGTLVTVRAENVPEGIRPEEHEAGLNSSLDNLAGFTEGDRRKTTH